MVSKIGQVKSTCNLTLSLLKQPNGEVFTTCGLAPEASAFTKRLAQKLSVKLDQSYSHVMGFLRRKLRIELLKTTLMAMCGFRKSRVTAIAELDLNLYSFMYISVFFSFFLNGI